MSADGSHPAGVARMTEAEIQSFVSHRNVGVLGLPDEGAPYVVPMSFDFDGENRLFFTFVLGEHSRKATLSDRAERASFLVYDATSPFIWESVVMRGGITRLPESEREEVAGVLGNAWRPEAFRNAAASWGTELYQFRIRDAVGLRATGLPAELDRQTGDGPA